MYYIYIYTHTYITGFLYLSARPLRYFDIYVSDQIISIFGIQS